MKQTTITDLAKQLGISASTVSRALNNHPEIKQATKDKVKALAEELNYEPNILARNLQAKHTSQIGVIVPEIKHNFFSRVISGIEEEAYKNGYTVVVAQSNEEWEREKINVNSLYLNRVAGILASVSQTTKNADHFKYLIDKGVKTVFFDRACSIKNIDKVINDDFDAAFGATEYLIKTGRKKIIHLAGPSSLQNCFARFNGYKAALEKHSIQFEPNRVVTGGMHEVDGSAAIKQLLQDNIKFDALFAVNDPVAIGAILELKKMKIKIPKDVAVIGFSNNPISEYIEPALTTVDQSAFEMGKKAAEILIGRIKGEIIRKTCIKKIIKTELIIRNSTEVK